MLRRLLAVCTSIALTLVTACSFLAMQAEETTEVFAVRDIIEIKTVSSAVVIRQADTDKVSVHISASFRPQNSFRLSTTETESKLTLTETFTANSTSGSSEWVVIVPHGSSVVIGTASGGVKAESFKGVMTVQTSSGKVAISNAEGIFDIGTASGRITASQVALLGESTFTSSSGHVEVTLATSLSDDLTIKTASGNAILNYADYPLTGTVVMVNRVDRGKIRSPYKPEHTESFAQGGAEYIRQTYRLGNDTPKVVIWSASGESVLRAR